jgi:hypothetical protein
MNAHAKIEAAEYVTRGQAILANGRAQDLCHHIYMASLGPEGEASREGHIEQAARAIADIKRLLGVRS